MNKLVCTVSYKIVLMEIFGTNSMICIMNNSEEVETPFITYFYYYTMNKFSWCFVIWTVYYNFITHHCSSHIYLHPCINSNIFIPTHFITQVDHLGEFPISFMPTLLPTHSTLLPKLKRSQEEDETERQSLVYTAPIPLALHNGL